MNIKFYILVFILFIFTGCITREYISPIVIKDCSNTNVTISYDINADVPKTITPDLDVSVVPNF